MLQPIACCGCSSQVILGIRPMRLVLISAICLSVMAMSGCLIPEGRQVVSGQKYTGDAIAFLGSPRATRQETIDTLGLPSWESHNSKVLLYLWESSQKWLFVPPESWADVGIRESQSETGEQRWVLMVAYDESGKVTAHTVRCIGKKSLENACISWSMGLDTRR